MMTEIEESRECRDESEAPGAAVPGPGRGPMTRPGSSLVARDRSNPSGGGQQCINKLLTSSALGLQP